MFIKHNHRLQHVNEGIFFIIVLQFNIQVQVTIIPLFQTPTTTSTMNHHLANAQTNHKKTKLNVLELWCLYQMCEWVRKWDDSRLGWLHLLKTQQTKKTLTYVSCLRRKKEKSWWHDATCLRNDKWEKDDDDNWKMMMWIGMISAQMATHNFGSSMSPLLLRYGVVKKVINGDALSTNC